MIPVEHLNNWAFRQRGPTKEFNKCASLGRAESGRAGLAAGARPRPVSLLSRAGPPQPQEHVYFVIVLDVNRPPCRPAAQVNSKSLRARLNIKELAMFSDGAN